jgi:hypothetical protein
MLLKNTAGQGIFLYEYTIATGAPKTGDSAQITGYWSLDGGGANVFGTTNPTELSAANMPGVYWQPLATGETNGNAIAFAWKSSSTGVAIDPILVLTTGANIPVAAPGAANGLFIAGSNAATSITTALTANITGNVSGSVGSVTGAVGSVTGAVGSVTGNVGGNVVGSTGSVTGAVGSVTGAVGSVTAGVTLASSQHVIVDSGTVTTLTNLPSIPTNWLTGTGVDATAVTKVQSGLATPTNITAGTITTVTNLTNAPTTGDLTSTMKTSVTAAASAATPTVAINTAQTLGAARALDLIADTSLTLNDALHCAIAAAAGAEEVVGTAYTVKTPHTATVLRTFTLDSGTAPTVRS